MTIQAIETATTLKGNTASSTKISNVSIPKGNTEKKVYTIEDAASDYEKITKQRSRNLKVFIKIGSILNVLRDEHLSDKDFGDAIKKTVLSKISARDRSDFMWLSANQKAIAAFKESHDITSSSPDYLRKKMRQADKKADEAKLELVDGDTEGGKESSTSNDSQTTESGNHPKRDIVDIAKGVIAECNNNNITVKQLIAALQAELKLTK
jgi:hypothetical protein|tara:strand:+ start:540 stop:1166 length:627 start_codon:yes stop_codon:yes gene_type:complete